MRSICLCLLFCLSVTASHAESKKTFDLETQLKHYRGKVVYLDFWASWCGPCRDSFPWMNEMQQRYQQKNFTVLSVNLDANKANAADFLAKLPAQFPVLYDPQGISARQLKVKGMPTSYIIDKNGKFSYVHVGFSMAKRAEYESQIKALIDAD